MASLSTKELHVQKSPNIIFFRNLCKSQISSVGCYKVAARMHCMGLFKACSRMAKCCILHNLLKHVILENQAFITKKKSSQLWADGRRIFRRCDPNKSKKVSAPFTGMQSVQIKKNKKKSQSRF
jgi:hypothetical protein